MNYKIRYFALFMAIGMVVSQLAIATGNKSNDLSLNNVDGLPVDEDSIITPAYPSSSYEKEDMALSGYEPPIASSKYFMNSINSVPGLTNWSFRDAHHITEAEALGYNGSGIVIGVADSGVDFCKSELQDSLKLGPDGWPFAMDIASLREYLGRGLITEDSWFADTSYNASVEGSVLPSFEYFHTPHFSMNGKADDFNSVDKHFIDTKEVTTTGQFWDGESWVSLDTIGGKDFDLQNLYVSRDKDNWYFGFNTRNAQVNRSYGIYLDFDNSTSGATISPAGVQDPRGNYVDTDTAHTNKVNSVAYHPSVNGQGLLASSSDGVLEGSDKECIFIWNEEGQLVRIIEDPTITEIDDIKSLAWTPAGDRLLATSRDFIFAWDTTAWNLIGIRDITASGLINFLSANVDGTCAAAANGSRIALVNPANMDPVNSPSAGGGTVQNVLFSPSGDRLAIGLNDGYVRIFNSADLVQPAPVAIREFASSLIGDGHDPGWPVKSLAWSPDGTYLATGGDDGRVFIWDTNTGLIAAAWNGTSGHPILSTPGSYSISGIVWNGGRIVVSTGDGTMHVINQAGFSIEKTLNNPNGVPISCSNIGVDSHTVFTGSDSAAIRLVNFTSSTQSDLAYKTWVYFKPDIIVYTDYIAESYIVDENGAKVIGEPDSLKDPQIYQWNSGTWDSSFLSQYGRGLYFYKGNMDVSSESEGLTELTSLGFVEIAVPRNITENYGFNSLSAKLFVTGEGRSVAQDCVPYDNNVKSTETDFITTNTTSLSSFGYVHFPHTTIELTGVTSKSGVYHYGFHPSDSLRRFIQNARQGGSDYVGILVVDANEEGIYDTVIIDLNKPTDGSTTPLPNYKFDDQDLVATKNNPFLTIDMMDTDKNLSNPDGINDFSAGIIYHISDGSPLPYSERLAELEVMNFDTEHPMPVPGAGEVVCFFGEFETYFEGNEELARKTGTISASAMGARDILNDTTGLGRIPGAATGVKLAAVGRAEKYFQSSIRFLVEGHDGIPGTGDDCSIVYVGSISSGYTGGLDSSSHFLDYMALDYLGGNVTFIVPAGNDGPGMGTVATPCPRNALVVGSSLDNAYDDQNINPEHVYGNVAQWSSRGPTSSGFPKPDIIASGIGRFSGPLINENTPGGSIWNLETVTDSRIAAAISAGVAAQVQQAFLQKHGRLPDMHETIGIMKASATDIGYDVLVQGSGFLNSLEAVRMAGGNGDIMFKGTDLTPSNYWNQEYQSFPQVMAQGTEANASVEIQNTGAATSVKYLLERHEPVWAHTVNYTGVKIILLNFTDVMPLNITYLKVTASANSGNFFKNTSMECKILVSNVFIISDWSKDSDPFPQFGDMNVLAQAEQDNSEHVLTNVIELEIGQPHQQFSTNIWFALNSDKETDWKVTLTGYVPETWDWITLDNAPATLSVGQESAVNITAAVPQNALPGTYSGSVRIMSQSVNVANEVLHSPPPGSLIDVEYEEVGVVVGSDIGTLDHGNLINGSLELVKTSQQSGAWVSYWNDSLDNNAAAIVDQPALPWNFTIPSHPGVPPGTPIQNVVLSWGEVIAGNLDWWCLIEDGTENQDYFVEYFTGGKVTFIDNGNWNFDGTIGWPGCVFFINYTYQYNVTCALTSPTDYSANLTSGVITFASQIEAGIVNVTANYSYVVGGFERLLLNRCRVSDTLTLTKFNTVTGSTETVPPSQYGFSPLTGAIKFHSPQSSIYLVNASYSYYDSTAIIPIVVNVGAAQVPSYSIGGEANSWINSPTTINGGYNFGLNEFGGDRRYFYFNVPKQGLYIDSENFKSVFNLEWEDVPTDIDIAIYSEDDNVPTLSNNVAPYILKQTGKGPVSPSPAFFTTSSGGANESLAFSLSHGLNVICLRAKLLNGTRDKHSFRGSGGLMSFTCDSERKVSTNQLQGSFPIQVMSNIEMEQGFSATVLGPAIGKTYKAEEVYPDNIYTDITQEDWWRLNSDAKYSKLIDVPVGTLSLDVHIIGYDNCPDLDLCLFYDGKNGQEDGIAQWDEYIDRTLCDDIDNYGWGGVGTTFKTYAYSAGAGSNEATKVMKPNPGNWIVKVVGYQVSGNPGQFDLIVKMIKDGVKGYEISSDISDSDPSENSLRAVMPIPGFDIVTYGIDWNFPASTAEDGSYSGALTMGNVYSPDLFTVPLEIYLDRVAPVLTTYSPTLNQHIGNPRENVFCTFSDETLGQIDKSTIRIYIDGEEVTSQASVSSPNMKNSAGAYGHWTGSVLWSSASGLSEGGHTASVLAGDLAGNILSHTWGFTVDSTMVELQLGQEGETIYVNTEELTLLGSGEPGAELTVTTSCEYALTNSADGSFEIFVRLTDELNELSVTSRDRAGNSRNISRHIILDLENPDFEMVHSSMGTVTNSGYTAVYGEVSEAGRLLISQTEVAVNSDLSFSAMVALAEGVNAINLDFTDLAGNTCNATINITCDTAAPSLVLDDISPQTESQTVNISGACEAGCLLYINGKPVETALSRQESATFASSVTLSPGMNSIVITAKDRAGNTAEEILMIEYKDDAVLSRNYAAIGMMAVLIILGFILGLLLMGYMANRDGRESQDLPAEEMPEDSEVPADAHPEIEEQPGESLVAEEIAEDAGPEESYTKPEPLPEQPADAGSESPAEQPEQDSGEPSKEAEPPKPEDPRIAKLQQAYESGKMSKELYEKNLKRFRGD